MIIDMRYHVASLVAVFFALALGILIGTAMGGDKALVTQQKRLIDRLEADFNQVRAERASLEAKLSGTVRRLSINEEFLDAALGPLTNMRLAGKRIALVRTGNSLSAAQEAKVIKVLKDAGADVRSTTTVLRSLEISDSDPREEILGALGLLDAKPDKLIGEIAWGIAGDIGRGTAAFLPVLEKFGFVRRQGDYEGGADAVVLLGGASDEALAHIKTLDLPLIYAFRGLGLPVVGIETSEAKVSYARNYRSAGISSVDNADMPVGLFSLVAVLQGKEGSYGIKESGKKPFPNAF